MHTAIIILLVLLGPIFALKAGKASANRKRQLWARLKAGKADAILTVVCVAIYVLYIMLTYEPS